MIFDKKDKSYLQNCTFRYKFKGMKKLKNMN